jgi:hypothetical protein
MGLFESTRRLATDPADRALTLSLPPPSPQEKHPRPTQKCLPIKTSSSPMRWPKCRFPEQPPPTNQLCGPHKRFVTGANKRPRVCSVKNTHLKHSCHRTGNNDQAFPTPNATRRVPARWARTTRSPDPVRGSTSPSTPHPPPWCEETYPKEESR